MSEFEKEQQKLKKTTEIISDLLEQEQKDLAKVYSDYFSDIQERFRVANNKKNHIQVLNNAQQNPYFARVDFKPDNEETKEIYIGRNGISKNGKIVITDWRAPISSLYYDSSVGKSTYKTPNGTIKGNVSLKRQYEIEDGNLIQFFDVDLVSSDNLLQKYLNNNNDSRLKTIVATIQSEQNDVIRRPISENLIVQGVAGSGKTTVALHKIAYLVYNYINTIKQSQYLVIGPNPVFIKYIKSVLPNLDVSEVKQTTFEEFAKMYINEDIEINSSNKKITASIANKLNTNIDKFKCSMEYKNMLELFLEMYLQNIVSKPLKLGDFVVLTEKEMASIFNKTKDLQYSSLHNRIENVIELVVYYITQKQDEIISRYSQYENELFQNATLEEKQKLRLMFSKDRNEIAKKCKSTIRKYFSKVVIEPTKLYKIFISLLPELNIYGYKEINELKKVTSNNIKNKTYDFEDLSALLYLKLKISPNREIERIKHVVIDEAQDLGQFNFYVLRNCLPNATFSIFGDLAQSIYDYRGIDNWDEVNEIMFDNQGTIINFNKSYRTTKEIMEVADAISESIGLEGSDLVVREGQNVTFSGFDNDKQAVEHIANKLIEYKEKGYKNIAVISKTDLLSRYINDDLSELKINIFNVTDKDDVSDDKFNVCTISNQLSKGLEFDAVIIANASENIYSHDSKLDMKLLYVASTRALHELDIVYTGELTEPLKQFVKKDKQKTI